MYIYGSFVNQLNDTISVCIVTKNDRTETLAIGTDEADVFFTDDPVEITSEVNDTFDVLLRQSASVRLLCGNLISSLFCTSSRDAVVNIYKNDKCVFAGYIEPQTFSQPYNERWDELELNCIDALSAMQYSMYKNVGAAGVDYDTVKRDATQRSFYDIMTEVLHGVTDNLDITGRRDIKFWYDGSKAIDAQAANKYQIFKQLSINELLFLEDEESSVWQQDEVMEEILKYLNLHIAQDGFDFYIYSWETVRAASDKIIWHDIEQNSTKQTPCGVVSISLDNVADTDTQISIGDVYNQLQLTADIEEIESVIESPLEDDLLDSPFANKQKYVTEYSSDGNGDSAYNAFYDMTHDKKTSYGGGAITDWYVRVQQNKQWTFPMGGDTSTDLVEHFCSEGTNQQALPDWLGQNPGACILSLGKVKMNTANDDNSPTSKVDMTNYLIMSVNGNEQDIDESLMRPNQKTLQQNIPYAVYNGNSAGGVFSPSDADTTNYIVFSGSLILNPIMKMTGAYTDLHTKEWGRYIFPSKDKITVRGRTVPSRDNGDGRYYTRQYWKAETPGTDETWNVGADNGLCPYTEEGPEQYEFKYSAIGDSTDTISKVPVLACMLVIGDKCVVETGYNGQVTDFEWRKFKERSECASDEEYYMQSFTIGFDPKIGDKLIGTDFDVQNNIDYKMGIDAEGTAIPIRKSDKVSGKVRFMLLGPVNASWGVYTRVARLYYRLLKGDANIPLLTHISNIAVKEFEVKVYSDNGGLSMENDDNDIVYISDTDETFINVKDDIEFKINSALTTAECQKLGVSNTIKMSTPLNISTGDGVLEVYDRNGNVKAKPEQIYVDSYYTEYHKPRVLMEQSLNDTDEISIFNHYRHEALGKEFYVQGIGRNLIAGSAKLTIKEVCQ